MRRLTSALALLALIITGFCSAAYAQDTGPAAARYQACMQQASSTAAMQACQRTGLADADKRLNEVYAKTMAALPADRRAKLRTAERTWITFRQQDCNVWTGSDTGTMATVSTGSCMIDRTEARIAELQSLVQH